MFDRDDVDVERLVGPPSVETVATVLAVDVSRLSSDDAVAVAAAAELAKRLFDGIQLRALAQAAGRRRVDGELSSVAQELSAATNVHPLTANCRTDLGCSVVTRLPQTLEKLESGRLTLRHLEMVELATRALSDEQARAVDAQLPIGPLGLKGRLMEAIARIAPDQLEQKAENARKGRTVDFWTDALDGIAGIGVSGPLAQVAQIKAAIDSLAHRPQPGNCRNLSQRRFDVVHDWARSILGLEPTTDQAAGRCDACGRSGTSTVPINVTVSLESLLRLSEAPGDLDGEPIPASVARELAADGRWRRWITETGTGRLLDVGATTYRPGAALDRYVRGRDRTCRFPSCTVPAVRCDADHVKAFHTEGGTTSEANLGCSCRTHHRLKHETDWTYQRLPDGDTVWTAPSGRTYTRPAECYGDDPALNAYLTRTTARRRERDEAARRRTRTRGAGTPDPWTTPPDPDLQVPW